MRTVTAFQLKNENQTSCLGLTSELTQGRASNFVENSTQNLFCRSFKVIQQTRHAFLSHRNFRFNSICWFSIKVLPTLKTDPKAESEKDSAQTSQESVHPGGLKSERAMPKSNLHQENVVTKAQRLSSSLISGSTNVWTTHYTMAQAFTEMLTFDEPTFLMKTLFLQDSPAAIS